MEKLLHPSFLLFSFYIFLHVFSIFLFCSFNNPSPSASQINRHVTSVSHSNPVKLTVVTVSYTELTNFLKRETWLAGTAK